MEPGLAYPHARLALQVGIEAYILWEKAGRPDGADFSNDARRTLQDQLDKGATIEHLEKSLKAPSPQEPEPPKQEEAPREEAPPPPKDQAPPPPKDQAPPHSKEAETEVRPPAQRPWELLHCPLLPDLLPAVCWQSAADMVHSAQGTVLFAMPDVECRM